MNGQAKAPGNDDADQPVPALEPPSPTPAAEHSPTIQPIVPDYELLRRIGRGAYGEVWLARSQATGALRAAKIVWRHTFEDAKPFQREFAGIQRFERISREHPSQLALFHIGRNEPAGYFYYVMELADQAERAGEDGGLRMENGGKSESTADHPLSSIFDPRLYTPHTLRADLEKGRLPAAKVLEIGLALSEALSHLHSNGLVHRDVKPSNVIFVNGRPKLADIGLVTDASDQCSIVGTEGYLPPEGPGTPQADIFALGKVLYEATTGLDRREFPKLPEDLRTWPDAAQVFELNEIILKACAQHAKDRYQTCEEMHADLALLGQGKSVKQKRTRQQRWSLVKNALVTAAVLGLLVASGMILSREIEPGNSNPDGPSSTNMEANILSQKGLLIIRGDNYAEFAETYTNFHEAIKLDPHFAQPYVGLLELLLREGVPSLRPSRSQEMRRIADKLGELAPHLAATAVARSIISYYNWDYPAARRFAIQASKINPRYELAHRWYGFVLTQWGRPLEGRKELEIARELAPSKVSIYLCLGHTYYAVRDFTNAIVWYRKSLELEPHETFALEDMGGAYQWSGDYSNGLKYLEKAAYVEGNDVAATKQMYDKMREAINAAGIPGFWQLQWKWTLTVTNGDFYWKGFIQMHLGHTNEAIYWLNRSYETREGVGWDNPLSGLLFDECWDGLHDDPRFKRLLDEIGFTKVMPPRKK